LSGKITLLEVQKRNKERVNVYLDGEFAFGLNLLDAALLHKGQELSDAEISALQAKDESAQAFESAVRFLAPRPRSAAEVRRRLQEKQINTSVIDQVIERLAALNYLNDLEFAQFWVRNREEFNPRGTQALRYELRQKGIEDSIIEQVLAQLDTRDAAFRAAEKKMRSLRGKDTTTIRQKLGDHLLRRGFSYADIRAVIDQIVADKEEADVEER